MAWPKRIKAYLHSDKESMRDLGRENGLPEASLDYFAGALYELEVELGVNEDGTYAIISVRES